MRSTRTLLVVCIMSGLAAAGCGDDGGTQSGSGSAAGSGAGKGALREVPCTDQSVSKLVLFDTPNNAAVHEESKDPGIFETFIDTSAGGLTPNTSFVYGRFGDDGLEQLAISDEDAFTSLDWDIAFRRYLLRLNSGVSGPGDVTGARTANNTTFETLDSVPDNLSYSTETYYTPPACDFVPDTTGLGGPATVIGNFWKYSMCVEMTHIVYVIALKTPKARHVKFEVMSYYTPTNQQICDQTGMVPMPTGAGSMRIRWAFLD